MDTTEKTSLESAIREEARRTIDAIARKEEEEIKGLDDVCAAGLEDFKKSMETRTDARIRQESSKAENRSSLEVRKLNLKSVEAFISRTVEEAAKGIRDNPKYKTFLVDVIMDAVDRIPDAIEVKLASEDLTLEKEIRETLKAAGKREDIAVVEDKTIKWGGCIIVDVSGGRVFDSTVARIYFKKSPLIRREVMKLLDDSSGDVT